MKQIKIKNREKEIDDIIIDLKTIQNNKMFNSYAIKENITFFKASKSILKYIKWIATKAPKLDSKKLLELTDLHPNKYYRQMHTKLIEVERKKFPGLIKPLVDKIVCLITNEPRPLVLTSLGGGG